MTDAPASAARLSMPTPPSRRWPTPPLDVDKTVSVAIIGGGYTGLSTALHLAEQGVECAGARGAGAGLGRVGQ